MITTFLSTRRIGYALALSVLAATSLLWIMPISWGIPSANYALDTPLARLLPVVLGGLAGTTVNPVAPAMEDVAPSSLLRIRLFAMSVFCILQLVIVVCIAGLLRFFICVNLSVQDVTQTLIGTLFRQGICIICCCIIRNIRAWFIPLTVLLGLLIFAYDSSASPRNWNMLLTITHWTIAEAVVAIASAALCLRWVRGQN